MPRFILVAVLFLLPIAAFAQEPIRFARTPAISPDGKTVAFSYLGDLWTVDANGGVAQHLTMHEKHDYNPVFSPDGKWIAFSSNRHGQYDVFVIPVKGGRPKRLTYDSADDHPCGWSPDSQNVLFMSGREIDLPAKVELYTVSINGGQPKRISVFEGRDGSYSPDGKRIAYVRGPGTWYRKGYRGSSNDDIWICDADGSKNRQITNHNGQDSYPMWSTDGKTLFYVSDVTGGLANLTKISLDDLRRDHGSGRPSAAKPSRITRTTASSAAPHRAANGKWIAYECGPDIWIYSVKDGKSRKLNIEVNADERAGAESFKTFTTGATEFVWSPDERHIAVVVHGEIFLMTRAGGKTKRLTDNPAFDHGIAWAPDGRKILFLSDRGGQEDIYSLESDDPEHPDLMSAHKFKTKQITNTPEAEFGISFAPDGGRIAFLRAGRLMTMDPDGKNEKILVADRNVFDYEWSPDGRWLCYAGMDGSFASELFIIPTTGATQQDPPRNITRFATYNSGVTWSRTGNKLAFISQRKGTTTGLSAYVMSLQKPAAAGTFPGKDIDWDNIHLRVKQPTAMATTECAISGDGSKIAFRAASDGNEDLWLANTDGGAVLRLTTGNLRPTQIQWSRLFPSQIYFRDGNGHFRAVMIGGLDHVRSRTPFRLPRR